MTTGKQVQASVFSRLESWGVMLRHRTPWKELTVRQQRAMIARGAIQVGLLAAALNDLRRRPAAQIHGSKVLWAIVSCINYLGVGPVAYFVLGRRRPASRHSNGDAAG